MVLRNAPQRIGIPLIVTLICVYFIISYSHKNNISMAHGN